MTRVAIIGGGIAGLTAARQLAPLAEVTLFEKEGRIGGHTHTHSVEVEGQNFSVDSGFIVCNRQNYPNFIAMLEALDVELLDTEMSFSARNIETGIEYNAATASTLFCQKRNVFRPAFWSMLADIRRFYKAAPQLLNDPGPGPSTGDFLHQGGYSQGFIEDHLIPMASALWSSPPDQVMDFPMRYMVQFFHHHQMLQISNRPQWQVVKGGSASYVQALLAKLDAAVEIDCPVQSVRRSEERVELQTSKGIWRGDQVVFACHSDQALNLLENPSTNEDQILGAIAYQANETVLHTDESLLPVNRRAWAAWNARVDPKRGSSCTVTYNMNILQRLEAPVTFCVTLNQTDQIDQQKILATMNYEHPVYTRKSVAAQQRVSEINGQQRSFYCGAWQGWGFHEDGVNSGLATAGLVREAMGA